MIDLGAFPQVFPIRLIWLQGLIAIFGGGSLVVSALLLVVVSDITLEYQRYVTCTSTG